MERTTVYRILAYKRASPLEPCRKYWDCPITSILMVFSYPLQIKFFGEKTARNQMHLPLERKTSGILGLKPTENICWSLFLFWIWDLFGPTVNLVADSCGHVDPTLGHTGCGPAQLRWRRRTSSQGVGFKGKLSFFGFLVYWVPPSQPFVSGVPLGKLFSLSLSFLIFKMRIITMQHWIGGCKDEMRSHIHEALYTAAGQSKDLISDSYYSYYQSVHSGVSSATQSCSGLGRAEGRWWVWECGRLCVLVKRGRCVLRTLQYHGCVSVPNQVGASLTQTSQVWAIRDAQVLGKPCFPFSLPDCSHRKGFSSHTPLNFLYLSFSQSLLGLWTKWKSWGHFRDLALSPFKELSIAYAWYTYLDLLVNDRKPFLVRWIRAGLM